MSARCLRSLRGKGRAKRPNKEQVSHLDPSCVMLKERYLSLTARSRLSV